MGSGTTGVVAKQLNRNFIGIEIDNKFFKMAEERIDNTHAKSNIVSYLKNLEQHKSEMELYTKSVK